MRPAIPRSWRHARSHDRTKPLVDRVPGRYLGARVDQPGEGLGRSRTLRHHPFPHRDNGIPVRAALPDAGGEHAPRAARPGRRAGAARGVLGHPARVDQRQPAPVQPGVELGGHDPPRAALRERAVQRTTRRLPRRRGADHPREGHRGSDRAGPPDRAAAPHGRQGLRRAREGALRGGRPARARRSGPRDRVPRRGRRASAIRCLPVPWPRSCSAPGRSRSGSSPSSPWPPARR